jgi:hypothetical protein
MIWYSFWFKGLQDNKVTTPMRGIKNNLLNILQIKQNNIRYGNIKLFMYNMHHLCKDLNLSIFVGLNSENTLKKMIRSHHNLRQTILSLCTVLFIILNSNVSYSQWGWDDDNTADSTESTDDSWGGDWGDDLGEEEKNDKGTPPKPIKKYERIEFIPVDSLTKLITYTAVHDVENECEECSADSLYFRAKKYLLEKFGDGKKFPKGMIIEDTKDQRIILKIRVPLKAQVTKHSKADAGFYEFKFQLWIRDYAYKYKFINYVHLDPVLGGKPGNFSEVYMEYYLKNETKVKQTDMLLMGVDRDMKELIDGLVKVMKDPVTLGIDEEDF